MELTLSKKYDKIIEEIGKQSNYQNTRGTFDGMELKGLRYTNDESYAVKFTTECLGGSEYLKLINKIMQESKLNNLIYCTLDDASKVEMQKDVLENLRLLIFDDDEQLANSIDSDIYSIFRINSKLAIELSVLKLYEKDFTFYESYGFIPININIKNLEDVGVNFVYINDNYNIQEEYGKGHICYLTNGTKDFTDNKSNLEKYIGYLNQFRKQIKKMNINLINFNRDIQDDLTNYPTEVNEVISKLEDSKDFTAEVFYIRSALDKLESEKKILIKIKDNIDFIDKINDFLLEFVELFGISMVLPTNPQAHFIYSENKGSKEEFINYIEAYLNLAILRSSNNNSYEDTKDEVRDLFEEIEDLLFKPVPAPRRFSGTIPMPAPRSSRPPPPAPPPPGFYKGIAEKIFGLKKKKITSLLPNFSQEQRDGIIKFLENKSHFSDVEKYFLDEFIADANTKKFKDFSIFFSPSGENETVEKDFEDKITKLKDIINRIKIPSGISEVNITEDDIITLTDILDTIRYTTENYIITVESFCTCITSLWDICRLCHGLISKNINDYAIEATKLKLTVRMCILILNRFFNRNNDYIGDYIGLNENQACEIPELNYLRESLSYENIKFIKNFYDGKEWGDTNKINAINLNSKINLKNEFKFSFDYLYYSIDDPNSGPSEDSYCIIIEFKYLNSGNMSVGGSKYQSQNKYKMIGGAEYVQKVKEKYIAINPFINIITNNSVILGKKIIEIVKYFTGENQSKSYYEVFDEMERERYEDLKKLVIVNGKKNFLKEELETMFYNNVKIKIKAYRKIFKQLYLEYTLDKNKIKVTIVILSFLREYLDIYFRQLFEEREIMREEDFNDKLEFYKFLKVKYGLK